jgi:hypothetical protein
LVALDISVFLREGQRGPFTARHDLTQGPTWPYIMGQWKKQGLGYFMSQKTKSDSVKLNLRLTKTLHKRLLAHIKGNSPQVSLQQEIVGFIERGLDDRPSPATMRAIEEAAKVSTMGGVIDVLSDSDIVAHLIAKYPRFRAAVVAALTTDDGRVPGASRRPDSVIPSG